MLCESIGHATLYLGDCRDVLPALGRFDALVTDPPYGIGEAAGRNASRGKAGPSGVFVASVEYGDREWDDEPIADDLLRAVIAAARWSVIFGGNFYALPPSRCWLVWDKDNGASDFADCELAWTNLPRAVRRLRFLWNGMMRAHSEPRGDHPTQKPVGVMKWVIALLPEPNQTILDPFMGSGTTGVAAIQMGRRFVGIEREPSYFDSACRRIDKAREQLALGIDDPSLSHAHRNGR